MIKVRYRPKVYLAADASGAVAAARKNLVVMVVDIIDMSTTLESALEAGATEVFGASPVEHRSPVPVCPGAVGYAAGQAALRQKTGVVVVAEPRLGDTEDRRRQAGAVLAGIRVCGVPVAAVVPNRGKETPQLFPMQGQVVVAVTASGGVAFDAAFNAGGTVVTGTIARTYGSKGEAPARRAACRALDLAHDRDICVVAASSNSLEDLLGARYISCLISGIEDGGECFSPWKHMDITKSQPGGDKHWGAGTGSLTTYRKTYTSIW